MKNIAKLMLIVFTLVGAVAGSMTPSSNRTVQAGYFDGSPRPEPDPFCTSWWFCENMEK